jgi:hypothetical protein
MGSIGFLGFVSSGFNVIGGIGGAFAGVLLGRYAGKKISKSLYQKAGTLNEFDIYLIRIRCVTKWT